MSIMTQTRFHEIVDILNQLNHDGGYLITVLTDENGFPIASSDGGGDASEVQAAVIAQIQKVVLRIQDHLDMASPEEMTLNDINGKKLVCRSFSAGGLPMLLAVLIPSREKTYRRFMNMAVRSVQKHWEGM